VRARAVEAVRALGHRRRKKVGGVKDANDGRLPELLDAKRLMLELGVTRAAAEAIMRKLPTVQFEDLRKTYVRRSDVRDLIERRTFEKDQVVL
jgi:hypothetical protein